MTNELTQKQLMAACWAYEDAMDGQRLPDGDGYDFEVIGKIYEAIQTNAPAADESMAVAISLLEGIADRNSSEYAAKLQPALARLKEPRSGEVDPSTVNAIARAFWRRIWGYRNNYDKELPERMPVEFSASMATALMHLQTKPDTNRIAELEKQLEAAEVWARLEIKNLQLQLEGKSQPKTASADAKHAFEKLLSDKGIAANYQGDGQYGGGNQRLSDFFYAGIEWGINHQKGKTLTPNPCTCRIEGSPCPHCRQKSNY